MKATLTFDIEVSSIQKATALRDKCGAWLREDPDVTVTNEAAAQRSCQFRVVGVDTASKDPFTQSVEATDEEQAKAEVIGRSKTRLVAEVQAQP